MNICAEIIKALRNIGVHGDTDVFPFPFERSLIQERLDSCVDLVSSMDAGFEGYLASSPPLTIEMLSQVGYTGFRRATLIEPFWNAYFLALVISLADQVEAQRIPRSEETVFSYRFNWDAPKSTLFADSTWIDYRRESLKRSRQFPFVLQTDIADFYPRVNHHRLVNALDRLGVEPSIPSRIGKLLGIFSDTASYGLPIGGPASRILAELALNDCDQHLRNRRIQFCRYADDYCLFCDSKSAAYSLIVMLSNKLANDGLSLQKHKTRILTAEEFADINKLLDPHPLDDPAASEEQKLLSVSIRFDPYSPTADEDYEALKSGVSQIDIIGILSREIGKTAVDQTVTKQAIDALKVLDAPMQSQALQILLDKDNLLTLSPVFPTVMRAARGLYAGLTEDSQSRIDDALVDLHETGSHLLAVELNVSYFIQTLALRHSSAKEKALLALYEQHINPYLRRQIILTMARWQRHYWLTDVKKGFKSVTEWERRAIIASSYRLGDEGEHWRRHNRHSWSRAEKLVGEWVAERAQANKLDGIS
ncbi:MAG TPA: RNA-directed DNA polymerase [Acidobacteriaceae bacterium]|nr:RNA-directed DNA polymerase [Acidobacteriaceae bacterium]